MTKWKWPKRLEKGRFGDQKEQKITKNLCFFGILAKTCEFGAFEIFFTTILIRILRARAAISRNLSNRAHGLAVLRGWILAALDGSAGGRGRRGWEAKGGWKAKGRGW